MSSDRRATAPQPRPAPARRPQVTRRPAPRRPPVGRRKRSPMRLPMGRPYLRIQIAMIVLGMLGSLLVVRAVQVQGLDGAAYSAQAARQMSVTRAIIASRG